MQRKSSWGSWIAALAFGALAGFKFFESMLDVGPNQPPNIVGGLIVMAIFGAPQLLWTILCLPPFVTRSRTKIGLGLAALYAGSAYVFGFLPGQWGSGWGEAHWEVPFAWVVESMLAIVAVVIDKDVQQREKVKPNNSLQDGEG